MVDQQNGVRFADFFMSSFLGCRLLEQAEIQTKSFVDATLRYINTEVDDMELQGRYATALVAYSNRPEDTVEAAAFAEQYLEPEDRDGFLAAMPESIADIVFSKDLTLVPGRGQGLRMYGQGVSISANAEALERGAIEIVSDLDGETVIRVRGSLRKLGLAAKVGSR